MKSTLLGLALLSLGTSALGSVAAAADQGASGVERICGWFQNPSPANVVLTDRHGDWTIAVQGAYEAEGPWPEFDADNWVRTNRYYGYGCACLAATVDKRDMRVIRIHRAVAQPLSTCTKDKAISGMEPGA